MHTILVHPLSTPVILLVTKITADLVQDGGARQDVGLVLFFAVIALHNNDDPIY